VARQQAINLQFLPYQDRDEDILTPGFARDRDRSGQDANLAHRLPAELEIRNFRPEDYLRSSNRHRRKTAASRCVMRLGHSCGLRSAFAP